MAKSQEKTSGVETQEDFRLYVEVNLPAILQAVTNSCFLYKLAPNQLITLLLHMNCPNGRFIYALLTYAKKERNQEECKRLVDAFLVSDEKRDELLVASLPLTDVKALLHFLKDDETANSFGVRDNPKDTWVMGCLESHVWVDGFTVPTSPKELDDALINSRKYCEMVSSEEPK